MKQRRLATLGSAALATTLGLLGACGTSKPFVPPTSGDTARLLIRPVVPAGVTFSLYTFEDQQTCRDRQHIVDGKAKGENRSSVLRAGSLATLEYVGQERRRSCAISFSFYPKPQHTYLLATSQDSERCVIRLLDVTDADNPRSEKSLVKRTRQGNGCAVLARNPAPVESIDQTYQGMHKEDGTVGVGSMDDFKDLLPN